MNKHLVKKICCFIVASSTLFIIPVYSNTNDECIWNSPTKQCTPDTQLYMQPVAQLDPDEVIT
jgi:hypothetical protein